MSFLSYFISGLKSLVNSRQGSIEWGNLMALCTSTPVLKERGLLHE